MSNKKIQIGKFSKITGLSIDTLRYYEKNQLLDPGRDENNRRVYSEDDVDRVALILRLKGGGLLIEEIAEYLVLKDHADQTTRERSVFLKSKLQKLYSNKQKVEDSIDYVEDTIELLDGQLKNK